MAPSRQRQSGAIATPASQRRAPIALPEYQHLHHPLNANAQRALGALLHRHNTKNVLLQLQQANEVLRENGGSINEVLCEKETRVNRQISRIQKEGEQNSTDGENEEKIRQLQEDLESMRTKVEKMTQQMDDSLRKALDGQYYIHSMADSIQEIGQDALASSATQNTQIASQPRSQRRRRRETAIDDDEDDDADESYQEFTPTDPSGGPTQATQQALSAPTSAFREKVDRKKDRYQSHSLTERYARNNDYKTFKRLVHESRHPGDTAPPLAHESTWFPSAGSVPAPGVTTRGRTSAAEADDDDDDLAIAKETISTKCPLTLQEFREPVTSRKCPHSFEKEAIESMIRDPGNAIRIGGTAGRRGEAAGGQRAVQCPVPGCMSVLALEDLHADAVLRRKIQRIQRAARMAEEDEEEDGRRGGATLQEIESGSEDEGMDIDRFDGQNERPAAVKAERMSRAPSSSRRGAR